MAAQLKYLATLMEKVGKGFEAERAKAAKETGMLDGCVDVRSHLQPRWHPGG